MKKLIIYTMFLFVLSIIASAQSVIRELPSSVSPGQSFTIKYQTQDISGNFGVLIDDSISGGCTPSSIVTGFLSPALNSEITVTAPSSGTCTFTGNYQFADSIGVKPEVNFASQSVAVTPPSSSGCVHKSWGPSPSTVCQGVSFKQTSNCGATKTSTGTKTCATNTAAPSKSSGSGFIFIIVAALIVLVIIFNKSILS